MPRKRKQPIERNLAREQEILASKVRMDGIGEDQVIKDLASPDYVTKPDGEILETNLALQRLLRGQSSILDNQVKLGEELSRMRKRMAKYDAAAAKWEADKSKFLEEMDEIAERNRVTNPAKRANLQAKIAQELPGIMAKAHADRALLTLKFEEQLATMPKVTVVSNGVSHIVIENGIMMAKLFPEIVQIRHKRWVLMPGVPQEVPIVVADRLADRRKEQQETAERKAAFRIDGGAMTESHNQDVIAAKWLKIDEKYNAPTRDVAEEI